MPACGYPRLIAACCVLHRLPAPRHPPHALSSLTMNLLDGRTPTTCVADFRSGSGQDLRAFGPVGMWIRRPACAAALFFGKRRHALLLAIEESSVVKDRAG